MPTYSIQALMPITEEDVSICVLKLKPILVVGGVQLIHLESYRERSADWERQVKRAGGGGLRVGSAIPNTKQWRGIPADVTAAPDGAQYPWPKTKSLVSEEAGGDIV